MHETTPLKSLTSGLTDAELFKIMNNNELGNMYCQCANILHSKLDKIHEKDPAKFDMVYDDLYNITLQELKIMIEQF